jgi:hypothetical protein
VPNPPGDSWLMIYGLAPARDPRFGFRVRFRRDRRYGRSWMASDFERRVLVTDERG